MVLVAVEVEEEFLAIPQQRPVAQFNEVAVAAAVLVGCPVGPPAVPVYPPGCIVGAFPSAQTGFALLVQVGGLLSLHFGG